MKVSYNDILHFQQQKLSERNRIYEPGAFDEVAVEHCEEVRGAKGEHDFVAWDPDRTVGRLQGDVAELRSFPHRIEILQSQPVLD